MSKILVLGVLAGLSMNTAVRAQTASAIPLPQCSLGENIGVEPSDAIVASRVLCAEVLSRAKVAGKTSPVVYRVHFGRLGGHILLQLTEHANGVDVSEQRQTQINGIEDVSAISGRLAEALVYRRNLSDSATTDNVLPDEAREARRKQGNMSVEVGLVGTSLVGGDSATPAPGLQAALTYHLRRGYISGSTRFGVSSNSNSGDLAIGGGLHLSDGDVAPYVGGGVAYQSLADSLIWADRGGSGFAPYGEIGVSVFRTSRIGLRAGARVYVPTFKMKGQQSGAPFASLVSDSSEKLPPDQYVVPVSLSLSLAFY